MRIHGRTDTDKLICVPLNVVTQKVLQVTAARHTGRLQHNLSYHCPCRSKVQRAAKKQNMTTVPILTLPSVLISPSNFCTQQTPKISQHDTSYSSSNCVSQQIIIIIL